MPKRSERRLMNRGPRFKVDMLGQQSKTEAAGSYDVTAIGRLLAIDQAKDRRFTRAIPANEPDMLARIYLQRDASQDILRAVRLVYL